MAEMNDKEIESFLAKVDQVESLIKGMTSGDAALEESSAKDADKFLGSAEKSKSQFCGFDKSHVNKYKDEKAGQNSFGNHGLNFEEQSVSPEEFMKRVEEDAAERQKQKEKDEKVANELKEKGNKAFKQGDFDDAIKFYTDAIAVVKDNTVLYTNRAQAYLRQKNNELALSDCLVALKLNKKCIKAYIHQGKSLQNLNRFDEAIESFNKVIKIDQKHKKIIQAYKEELERKRKIYEKEQESSLLAASGDEACQTIKVAIEEMRRGGLSYEQICARVHQLKSLLDKAPYKTFFRTAGGFRIVYDNPSISRLIKKDAVDQEDERKCLNEILDLFSIVCTDNDENIEELINPSVLMCLQRCINSSSAIKTRITTACLVHRISQTENGRKFLLKDGESGDILDGLLSLLTHGGETAVVAVGAINNLALYERLSEESTSKLGTKFVTFVVTMNEVLSTCKEETPLTKSMLQLIPTSLSTITNLLRNFKIRSSLGDNHDLWKSSASLLGHYEASIEDSQKYNTVYSLLGLLMNLSAGDKRPDLEICKKLHDVCCHLIVGKHLEIIERASGLLNHLMTSCLDLTQYNMKTNKYKQFVTLLKSNNEPAKNYIIKCIALCSADSVVLAKYIIEAKVLENLLTLLQSDEEMVVGNTALVIGNCAKYDVFTNQLGSTDVIKELLRIATNDEYKNKVKHNAAIAIGKLATTNQRHLERLRELHGLEILHEVMKLNNAI